MQNDRLNNTLQEKLSGFSELPANSTFSVQGSWQKLEAQLPQQKRRGIWWYRSAAAVVMCLATALFFFKQDKPADVAIDHRNDHVPAPTTHHAPVQQVPVASGSTASTAAVKKTIQPQPFRQPAAEDHNAFSKSVPQPTIALPVVPDTSNKSMGTVALVPVTTVTPAVAVVKPAQIKVIHLNDLNDDPYYREAVQKGKSNFSFSTPFRSAKENESPEPRKLRLRLPVSIN